MAQTQLRPVTPREGAGPGNLLSSTERKTGYSASSSIRQDRIDPIVILAARSRVSPATVRAHFDAWQIGGAV